MSSVAANAIQQRNAERNAAEPKDPVHALSVKSRDSSSLRRATARQATSLGMTN